MKGATVKIAKTSERDQKVAMESVQPVRAMASFLKTRPVYVQLRGSSPEEAVEIPGPAFELLVEILSNMAEGKEVAVTHVDQELTTQEAADLIGVSRPFLINSLLESGEIPFVKVGRHRRVKRSDVLTFKEQQRRITEESLQFLADEAQELNLGF